MSIADPAPRPFTGAVLAGGASRRMGAPKALLVVDGLPLGRRVADVLTAAGARAVVLVGGDPAWAAELGLAHRPDRWPDSGPLAGLATAVAGAAAVDVGGAEALVVAACDQVGLTPAAVRSLVDGLVAATAAGPGVVGAVPGAVDGVRQPFPSAWHPAAASPLVELVEAGERRAGAALDLAVVEVDLPAGTLADLDTPADVAAWLDRASLDQGRPGRSGP